MAVIKQTYAPVILSFLQLSTSFYCCYTPHRTWFKWLASLCRSIKPSFCRLPSRKSTVTIQNYDHFYKTKCTLLWPILYKYLMNSQASQPQLQMKEWLWILFISDYGYYFCRCYTHQLTKSSYASKLCI